MVPRGGVFTSFLVVETDRVHCLATGVGRVSSWLDAGCGERVVKACGKAGAGSWWGLCAFQGDMPLSSRPCFSNSSVESESESPLVLDSNTDS